VRAFPGYVARVEAQLAGTGAPGAREAADGAYDTILSAMFGALRVAAKTDGTDGEDKGQLMYHVTLIGTCAMGPTVRSAAEARRRQRTHTTLPQKWRSSRTVRPRPLPGALKRCTTRTCRRT
jgi:hypothetical protein